MDEGSETANRKFTEIVLTKKRVAREQIDLAIDSVFRQNNPACANTLAWAATDVLQGVATENGVSTFHDFLESEIKPDKKIRAEWRRHLKRAYTFSKHARDDPRAEISDFRPESTTCTLFGACWTYNRIYQQMSWSMFVHRIWFSCRNPDIVPAGMAGMAAIMEPILGIPAYFDLRCAAKGASELLHQGINNPQDMARMLGGAWSEKIEDFSQYFSKPSRIPIPKRIN